MDKKSGARCDSTTRADLRGTTKTIFIYGAMGLITMLSVAPIALSTGNPKLVLLYALPLIVVAIAVALFFDAVGYLCVLLAILPFSFGIGQIEIGIVTFTPFFLGIGVTTFFVLGRSMLRIDRFGFGKLDLALTLLCLTYLVSTLFSDKLIESGFLAFRGIFIPVLAYFSIKGMVRMDSHSRQAIGFFVAGITIFGIFGIGQFTVTYERNLVLGVASIGLATFTVSAAYYLFFLKWWRKLLGFIALLVCLTAFLLSLSRVYLLIVLLSPWIFHFIRRGKGFHLFAVMMPVTLVATLLVTAAPDSFKPLHYEQSKGETVVRITQLDYWKASLYGRAITYQESLRNFKENPFFGTGLREGKYTVTTHNFHLEWLEYGGVVGYFLYASIFFVHFWSAGKAARFDSIIAVNLLIIATILFNAVTNGLMHGMMPYVAWICIGMNEARVRFVNTTHHADTKVSG